GRRPRRADARAVREDRPPREQRWLSHPCALRRAAPAGVDAMVQTNLTGVFLLSQAAGRVMIKQGGGKIVNVTSVAGRTGSRGMAAYAAAKAGVTALTQSLGAEWAKYGITVNAVAPGPTETEAVLAVWKTPAMIANASREVPLQRLGRPEEMAWAVIFVASEQANFMTGETVYVSGGPRVANRED